MKSKIKRRTANVYSLTGDKNRDFIALTELLAEAENGRLTNSSEIKSDCNQKLLMIVPHTDKTLLRQKMLTSSMGFRRIDRYLYQQITCGNDRFNYTIHQKRDRLNDMIAACEYYENVFEALHLFDDESKLKRYCYFENNMEETLFRRKMMNDAPKTEIIKIAVPISEIYFNHGMFLSVQGRYDEAVILFSKAAKYQPCKAELYYEWSENVKKYCSDSLFLELIMQGYRTSYSPAQVARAYRGLAYLFSKQQQWQFAFDAIMISKRLDENIFIQQELDYIRNNYDDCLVPLSDDEERCFCLHTGVTGTADSNVIKILSDYCLHLYQTYQNGAAARYIGMLWRLTGDSKWHTRYQEIVSGKHKLK